MKYTIEINGLETGDIKVTIRSMGVISEEELAKIFDTMMGCCGITGAEKVSKFCVLLIQTAALYEQCPREMITIDLKKAKQQAEEGES